MKDNTYKAVGSLVVGAALLAVVFLPLFNFTKSVQGVCLGLGMALAGMGIMKLIMLDYGRKNPTYARERAIEEGDERNQQVTHRAKAAAADLTQWLILGLAYISILMDYPIWYTGIIVGVYGVYVVLTGVFINHFQKLM